MISVLRLEAVTISNPDESTVSGVDVVMRLTPPELEALLSGYDPDGASTPSASVCRSIARPIAAAITDAVASGEIPPILPTP